MGPSGPQGAAGPAGRDGISVSEHEVKAEAERVRQQRMDLLLAVHEAGDQAQAIKSPHARRLATAIIQRLKNRLQ
jgi:hypothetical protein